MALIMGDLYRALREANVPEELAKAAAEEVATHHRIVKIESGLGTLKWMLGGNIGLTVLLLGRVFFQ